MHNQKRYTPDPAQEPKSLRDEFAMKSMPLAFHYLQKTMTEEEFDFLDQKNIEPTWEIKWVARYAYVLADAMLLARKETDWPD